MSREKRSIKQVRDALRKSGGILSVAAQNLNICRKTMQRYIARHPELEAVRDECVESITDLAESKLISAIQKEHPWALRFWLMTRAKHRGYVTGTDITSKGERIKGGVQIIMPDNGREADSGS